MTRRLRRPSEAKSTGDGGAPAPQLGKPAGRRLRRVAELPLRPRARPSAAVPRSQLAVDAILQMGVEARNNLTSFYDLVIREETSKAKLQTAPHQQVMFSFVAAHRRCVFRMPINTAKTYSMSALAMWLMGRDCTSRSMIASATQQMASKPLRMVADYIVQPDLSKRLALAFPKLRKSTKSNDPWTTDRLTVQRPDGIRDPSLVAVGIDTKFQGARLSFLLADDVVNEENSRTKEVREALKSRFMNRCVSRLDQQVGSETLAVVTNTPWDREDLTYYLELEAGWATCVMDIYGDIRFTNVDAAWLHQAEQQGLIRPSRIKPDVWRLAQHDPDPDETIPLWPERFPLHVIEKERKGYPPHEFARLYLCEPFDAEAQRCQRDWVEKCKKQGIGLSLVQEYKGANPVYMGVDLGIGTNGKSDRTVFFIFEVQPDGRRRLLWVESGRWQGPIIVDKLIALHDRYGAVANVETVQAQEYIRQFALKQRADLQVHAHTTTSLNKRHTDFGVESIFTEVRNGAWIIPCDNNGTCELEVQRWIDDMLFYQPTRHTGDHLMACWIGRERARRYGVRDPSFQSTAVSPWLVQSRAGGF